MRSGTVALGLLTLVSLSGVLPYAMAISPSGSVFVPLTAIWGTSSSPVEAAPGSQNVLLTVSTAYTGGTQATSILATLRLPTGITDVYANQAPIAGATAVNPNSIFDLTYNLNIAASMVTGTYTVPIQFTYTTAAGGNNAIYAETDNTVINVLGTVTLEFRASQSSLNSGEVNVIQVTLSNTGTGPAAQVTPTVSTSAPSGGGVTVQTSSSGAGVSILSALPAISSLGPGESRSMNVSVYVPASIAGSSVSLYFSATYSDPYGVSKTLTQGIGLYAISVPVPALNFNSPDQSVVPGGVNQVPVTLSNLGPGVITRVFTTISVPSEFSVLNQFPTVESLNAGSNITISVKLFVPTSAAGASVPLSFTATYIDAYGTSRTATQTLGLYALSSSNTNTYSSISISVLNNSLTAGQISPVVFSVKNIGTLPLNSPTFALSVSSPLVVSGNSSYSLPGTAIKPEESVTFRTMILSSIGATGGSYPGTLTIQYTDVYGDVLSQTFNVGFALATPVTQISVDTLSSKIWVGNTSLISLQIRNTGTATLYSPVFSLSTPSPLAVITNSTFSRPGLNLRSGQELRYEATIANGPKTTEGAYVSTLTVTYTDQFGNSHSSSFPVGVIVVGAIQFVIQNEQVTQNAGNVAISGTLINEGAGAAFYTQMNVNLTASSKLGSGSTYVGEVDPNTPLPFSITINIPPLASAQSARIVLSAKYQNDFGEVLQSSLPATSISLLSDRELGQQGGTNRSGGLGAQDSFLISTARMLVLAAILIAIVASAVYLRMSKGRGKQYKQIDTPREGKENKVF